MTRRRRHPLRRRKAQRTLLQIAILVTVLAFIGLYNPVIRAGVNATLVWLVVRGLILGVVTLAIMWTYQFCRPPKVKRQTIKQPIPHRRGSHTSQGGNPANGAITTPTAAPAVAPASTMAPRYAPNAPNWQGTNSDLDPDDLANQPMSGAHRYRP